MLNESKLKIYAIGYIAKDIQEDSVFVDIYPAENLNTHSGELNEENIVHTTTKDVEGKVISINIDKSRLITAKWLPLHQSNRVTAPNVCKGETVIIYNYAGTDKYFWNTMYAEPDLRKKEKVTYFFSNKDSIDDENWPEHSYTLTIDTINKLINLRTFDNDGELTTYEISINTAEGMITIVDGKDNSIVLDSELDKLSFTINDLIETKNKRTLLQTKKFGVTNGVDEIVALMVEWLDANITEQHIGNLGIDTGLNEASISKYEDIKSRLSEFIDG